MEWYLMATPNARQIVFGTSVVPKKTADTTSTQETLEDGTTVGVAQYTDTILDTTIAKRTGGKGTVTVNANQDIDGWISVTHPQSVISDTTNGMDQDWDDTELNWDEVNEIASDDFTIRDDTEDCNFLYVKNTGKTVEARLALAPKLDAESEGDQFDILIPPGASVSIRLNSVSSQYIKADTASSSTTIEYVLAKE